MIRIKGITISTLNEMRALMGCDVITSTAHYATESLYIVSLSDDVMLSAHSKGFIVLNRNGNIVTLTNDDYVEIAID